MRRLSRIIKVAAIVLGFSLSTTAKAQTYPTRDITFIVPYGPGGSTDPLSRYFSNALEKILKTNVNVENKPGGSASIGTSAIPDATSIVDAGYNVSLPASYGIIGPKGMPKEVQDRLVAASLEIGQSAEFNEFAKKHGYLVDAQGPDVFRTEIDQYSAQFSALIKFLEKK